ncbi:hypothetical protein PYW07_015786 [Mythimna separata]|uniref:Uncharacterized protein n=1 Tax=Mythimna separata TaxID=271217 RepID=A0AAD8DVK4_MYTSE|nr:hypothetical protein PYW07_015786 [Mythimna separata]
MEFRHTFIFVVLLVVGSYVSAEEIEFGRNDAVSNQTATAYSVGVDMGIINPEKYSLKSFEQDERNIFKDLYQEYIYLNYSQPLNYQEWLIMNNYGILSDTQESLFQRKIVKQPIIREPL